MKELKVKPIPTRNWKNKNIDLEAEIDNDSGKLQESVDKRIYYMWFNYLKLCFNLEEINYAVENRGVKEEVHSETAVKVNRKIYKDWDLEDLYTMNFKKWYKDPNHKVLFAGGAFKPQGGARYHSLVKRYNVFIEYYNGMNRESYEEGDISKEMQVCEYIIMKYQKKRFDQLKILSCCQGEFPKSK